MTTNYHDPILADPNQEATADLFNERFADLDSAISDNATSIGPLTSLGTTQKDSLSHALGWAALRTPTTNTLTSALNSVYDLIAGANGAYPTIDARLDYMESMTQVAGGNVATKANGVSAAGQTVLTVDSTDGFVVNAKITYLLNGTTLEGNTIVSIQAGVSLTLGTNIGSGGVLDNTYISMISLSEYMAAQAIPHAGTLMLPDTMAYANGGVFNVKAFGAKGDGTTDDRAALEAAWVALSDGDTLLLPSGTYMIADTVEWTGKTAITIMAANAKIMPKSGVSFANKAVLDMRGSQYCNVVGLRLDCDLSSNLPDVGLELHRTVDEIDGGANRFDNCWFSGKYDVAVVFEKGSELTSFWHCRFLTNVAGVPCYLTTSVDVSQTAGVVSNVCKRFYDCTFLDYSNTATGQVLIEAQGVSKELSFRDCYCALSGTGTVIRLSGTGASMYGLVVDNMRVEGPAGDQAASRLLYCGQDNAASNCMISGITWTIDSDYVIEVSPVSALRASMITLLYPLPLAGTTKWIHVSNNVQYNHIVLFGSEMISIDAGDSAFCNYIVAFGSGSVFTGAGAGDAWPRQDNMVAMLYDNVASLSVPRIGVSGSYIDGHSATPSVAGSSQIDLQQDAETTITSFTGFVGGQEVTLLALNGNTTIAHGSTIKLKGSTNWNLPAGATLTLKYFTQYSAWYEVGRMDPS